MCLVYDVAAHKAIEIAHTVIVTAHVEAVTAQMHPFDEALFNTV